VSKVTVASLDNSLQYYEEFWPLGQKIKVTRKQAIELALRVSKMVFWHLNEFEVVGWENLPMDPSGVIMAAEHWSLIDSFMLGTLWCRDGKIHSEATPWNLPDAKNFMKNDERRAKILRLFRVIEVARNEDDERVDPAALFQAIRLLQIANLMLFPSATRQRPGQIYRARPALGLLAQRARCVVPVAYDGMDQVQPFRKAVGDPPATICRVGGQEFDWRYGFTTGNKIKVVVGEPIYQDQAKALAIAAGRKEGNQAVADHVWNAICGLRSRHLVVEPSLHQTA
jgi:1-acyl-sn-glycerol-3-phosphate acyltransferase